MSAQTTWTKAKLQRLQQLDRQGKNHNEITDILFEEFGSPTNAGETKTELAFLKTGPRPSLWTSAMEARVKTLYAEGKNATDITTQLFHEFAKPDFWQETYRKVQQMKLRGQL